MLALGACVLSDPTGPSPVAPEAESAVASEEAGLMQDPAVANPALLVGLDRNGVTALLGKPGFTRNDGPARVLQYSSAACVLDLFLYRKETEISHRVTHVEMRGLGAIETTPVVCMRSLAKSIRRVDA
jgi:hypothetical protein